MVQYAKQYLYYGTACDTRAGEGKRDREDAVSADRCGDCGRKKLCISLSAFRLWSHPRRPPSTVPTFPDHFLLSTSFQSASREVFLLSAVCWSLTCLRRIWLHGAPIFLILEEIVTVATAFLLLHYLQAQNSHIGSATQVFEYLFPPSLSIETVGEYDRCINLLM